MPSKRCVPTPPTNRPCGCWWRFQSWIQGFGTHNITVVLLGLYVSYRLLDQGLEDLGMEQAATVVTYTFLAFALYTWVAPAMMQRAIRRELDTIGLAEDF